MISWKGALLLALGASSGSAMELTPDNWDAETGGKTVFLKYFAPWCGHCKKLKPDWDKLIDAFAGSSTQLIADVDCTAEGKPLCDAAGVRGFPTSKWGDPSDLQDYQGGRSYGDLKKFVDENLKPMCSVKNIDLCDDEQKAEIEKFLAMDVAKLEGLISEEETKLEEAEKEFKDEVHKLQSRRRELRDAKDKTIADVKMGGLGLMKSALASKKEGDAKDEL